MMISLTAPRHIRLVRAWNAAQIVFGVDQSTLLDVFRGNGGDAQRNILQPLGALGRRHDDLFQSSVISKTNLQLFDWPQRLATVRARPG